VLNNAQKREKVQRRQRWQKRVIFWGEVDFFNVKLLFFMIIFKGKKVKMKVKRNRSLKWQREIPTYGKPS
jgi:hypothetical protein